LKHWFDYLLEYLMATVEVPEILQKVIKPVFQSALGNSPREWQGPESNRLAMVSPGHHAGAFPRIATPAESPGSGEHESRDSRVMSLSASRDWKLAPPGLG
jgi:hypothetical protein